MKKSILFLLTGLLLAISYRATSQAPSSTTYSVSLDLGKVENDELTVKFKVSVLPADTVVFAMPGIVPGTYSVYDFGRFIKAIHASSTGGDTLPITRLDTNRWQIAAQAGKPLFINYRVSDSFDNQTITHIFDPAGTSFEAGKGFVLNLFGIVGFLQDHSNLPYRLTVSHPKNLYGSSSMPGIQRGHSVDVFTAPDYFSLHDNPILYAPPDTASVNISGLDVQVAVYSPNNTVSAKAALEKLKPVLDATGEYLDGEMRVKKYTVILYLASSNSGVSGYGALEHNHSTTVVLPELGAPLIASNLKEVVAHEFLHILAPLNIHSEQIDNYDFLAPKMSRHLWFYEGCTEYLSHLVQARAGLYTNDEFMGKMSQKMKRADSYGNDVAFTDLSKGALDEYSSLYANVYQKGALICLCADLKMQKLTGGAMDIGTLMDTLSRRYGPDKPFTDTLFFKEIASLTDPKMEDFLESYVGDNQPLPYQQLFSYAGYRYEDSAKISTPMLPGVQLTMSPDSEHLQVADTSEITPMGRELELETGDILLAWNGQELTTLTFNLALMGYMNDAKAGDKVVVEVSRATGSDEQNQRKKKKLKARVKTKEKVQYHSIRPVANPGNQALEFRKRWLNN